MSDCKHPTFRSEVEVTRISDREDIITADVRIWCGACGQPFEFAGMPIGFGFSQPGVSGTCQEARLPIRPAQSWVAQGLAAMKTAPEPE